MEGYEYWLKIMLMILGTVSTNIWKFPIVQAEVCVMLVHFYCKLSCARYVMGTRIFSWSPSYSVYKITPKLPISATLRLSEC